MIRVFHKNLIGIEEAAYHGMYDMLSSYGRKKADSAGNDTHKRQRIAAYYMLAKNGGEKEGVYHSISHSGNLVCVAISDKPVGIDTEEISRISNEKIQRIARSRFFTENEHKAMADGISTEDFLKLWTFKEAMTKATGTPLAKMLGMADYYKMLYESDEDDLRNRRWLYDGDYYTIKQYKRDGGIYTVVIYV